MVPLGLGLPCPVVPLWLSLRTAVRPRSGASWGARWGWAQGFCSGMEGAGMCFTCLFSAQGPCGPTHTAKSWPLRAAASPCCCPYTPAPGPMPPSTCSLHIPPHCPPCLKCPHLLHPHPKLLPSHPSNSPHPHSARSSQGSEGDPGETPGALGGSSQRRALRMFLCDAPHRPPCERTCAQAGDVFMCLRVLACALHKGVMWQCVCSLMYGGLPTACARSHPPPQTCADAEYPMLIRAHIHATGAHSVLHSQAGV